MGLMAVVIFCELIHELCHHNVFKSKKLNETAFLLFDFLGANSYIWRLRHLRSHHRYPNVQGWDTDIEQKGPIAVYHDEELSDFIKYQNIYVFFLYPLFMIHSTIASLNTSIATPPVMMAITIGSANPVPANR